MKIQTLIEEEKEAEEALKNYLSNSSPEAKLRKKASQAKLERLRAQLSQAKASESASQAELEAKGEESTSLHKLSKELQVETDNAFRKARQIRGQMAGIASKVLTAAQEAERLLAEIEDLEKELNKK